MSQESLPSFRKFRASGFEFEVFSKYEMKKVVGCGAFGIVTSALNTETNQIVAIKKVVGALDGSSKCKLALREIKLMRTLSHENLIHLIDIIPPASSTDKFQDLYLVTDLMETDLHRVICSKQDLTEDHIQCFLYQILRGLKYIHSANIIHRDLKPSNILVNSNCDVKICDFGLSRLEDDDHQSRKTEYVVTRWYRAPEVMLTRKNYGRAIDIWSTGCILGEMLNRQPLFPGKDYLGQISIICEKIGKPTMEELSFVTTPKAIDFILSLPDSDSNKKFEDLFPLFKHHSNIMDLAKKMLCFQPASRITVEDAIKHPFLDDMHNPEDEPIANIKLDFKYEKLDTIPPDCAADVKEQKLQAYFKQLIWNEIREIHPYLGPSPPIAEESLVGTENPTLVRNGSQSNPNLPAATNHGGSSSNTLVSTTSDSSLPTKTRVSFADVMKSSISSTSSTSTFGSLSSNSSQSSFSSFSSPVMRESSGAFNSHGTISGQGLEKEQLEHIEDSSKPTTTSTSSNSSNSSNSSSSSSSSNSSSGYNSNSNNILSSASVEEAKRTSSSNNMTPKSPVRHQTSSSSSTAMSSSSSFSSPIRNSSVNSINNSTNQHHLSSPNGNAHMASRSKSHYFSPVSSGSTAINHSSSSSNSPGSHEFSVPHSPNQRLVASPSSNATSSSSSTSSPPSRHETTATTGCASSTSLGFIHPPPIGEDFHYTKPINLGEDGMTSGSSFLRSYGEDYPEEETLHLNNSSVVAHSPSLKRKLDAIDMDGHTSIDDDINHPASKQTCKL